MYGSSNYGTNSYASSGRLKIFTLICTVGSFVLAGVTTIFTKSLHISLGVGSFALTGINLLLIKGYNIIASVGEFILIGQIALLNKGYNLVCSVGSFVLTGIIIVFTMLRGGILKPISYIEKINIKSGISSLVIKSKVLKENVISKFK